MSVLTLKDVEYRYAGATKPAITGVNATFEEGRLYAIVGKSGSGKTTLLSLLAGLDKAANGVIEFHGNDLARASRDSYRARDIGVVFQAYNLLTNATAIDNVVLSMQISGTKVRNRKEHALALLEQVGIDAETAGRKILQLSGGEQQRVAIARAVAHDPSIVLADEPTGNLDRGTRDAIMEIFSDLAHTSGKAVILVTHSQTVADRADVKYRMQAGRLQA